MDGNSRVGKLGSCAGVPGVQVSTVLLPQNADVSICIWFVCSHFKESHDNTYQEITLPASAPWKRCSSAPLPA